MTGHEEHQDDDQEPGYQLVVPFVVCKSNGGPYDDEAYVAGWEMGALAARIAAARAHGLGLPGLTLHRGNLPQLDLLAMQNEAVVHEVPMEGVDEATAATWAHVHLEVVPPAEPEV